MTAVARLLVAVGLGGVLTLGACGDDGPGRAAPSAAERRAGTTVPDPADAAVEVGGADADTARGSGGAVSSTTAPDAVVEPTGVVVSIAALDNSFRPEVVEVDVGDEVLWENRGINDHDVLYVDGDSWGVEVEGFGPGAVYTHVFTEPGEYRYYCSIHGNETIGMVGTVIVGG